MNGAAAGRTNGENEWPASSNNILSSFVAATANTYLLINDCSSFFLSMANGVTENSQRAL